MYFSSLAVTAPVIPAEAFKLDVALTNHAVLGAVGMVAVISLVAFFAGILKPSEWLGSAFVGFAGLVAVSAFIVVADGQRQSSVTSSVDAAAKVIAAEHDVSLNTDSILEVRYDKTIEPVGRFKSDPSKVVYGSYVNGGVRLFIAQGAEYVPLAK